MRRDQTCRHPEADVVLYVYDELDPAGRAAVAARLEVCASCRAVYEEMTALQQAIQPPPAPDEATLFALRRAVTARLRALPRIPRPAPVRPAPAWLTPVWRLALAAVLVAVGFWWGRRPAAPAGGDALAHLILASSPVSTPTGHVEPALAGVKTVTFDPATGTVQVRYQTVNEVMVQGGPEDPAIRRLMQHALREPENPGARLSAIRVLDAVGPAVAAPDTALVDALTLLLEKDPNDGIRLQAVRALRTLYRGRPLSPAVKQTLLHVLLDDRTTALRIEAIEALTEGTVVDQELIAYLHAVRRDPNAFIRFRASSLLKQNEVSRPLEQLPDIE